MLEQISRPTRVAKPLLNNGFDLLRNLNVLEAIRCFACMNCGALILAGNRDARDLAICDACDPDAVNKMAKAQAIFREILQWIGAQGFHFNNLNLRLELRTLAQLVALGVQPESLGVTLTLTEVYNQSLIIRKVNGVAILRGLPDALFRLVAVHELGHAWLAVHQAIGLPLWQEEGFCQWLAHRYLLGLGTETYRHQVRQIERRDDDTYGDGFRRIANLEKRVGFSRLRSLIIRPLSELQKKNGGGIC